MVVGWPCEKEYSVRACMTLSRSRRLEFRSSTQEIMPKTYDKTTITRKLVSFKSICQTPELYIHDIVIRSVHCPDHSESKEASVHVLPSLDLRHALAAHCMAVRCATWQKTAQAERVYPSK